MAAPKTAAELAAHLHEKADRYERQADELASPILAGEAQAKAETARYAARLIEKLEQTCPDAA